MKDILYFIAGAAIGALFALFMAPKSGQELREDLQERANLDLQRLQLSYEQKLQDVNQRMEALQAQIKQKGQQPQQAAADTGTANTANTADTAAAS